MILQLVSPWRLEERENDGLVTGDMADAIIRRITKRRKHRRRRKRFCQKGCDGYPLVNIQKAIENCHRNSEFSHERW